MIQSPRDRFDWKRPNATLIAIALAIATISILVAAGIFLRVKRDAEAKVSTALSDIKRLEVVLTKYKLDVGEFPKTLTELAPVGPATGLWYLEDSMLKDPWGNDWEYNPALVNPKTGIPRIGSLGPPGQNAPIHNWSR
jgi:general secretion pathway protein G